MHLRPKVILFLLCFAISVSSLAQTKRCAVCRDKITGKYIAFDGKYYHPACYDRIAPRCAVCKEKLDGRFIKVDGKTYHEDCYNRKAAPRCEVCGKTINGQYLEKDGRKYHKDCYLDNKAPRCAICDKPITGKYIEDHWGNIYHENHERELIKCEYCGRLICSEITGGGHEYSDGRSVCNLCYASAVKNESAVKRLSADVARDLRRSGIEIDLNSVSVQLVDLNELRKISGNPLPREMGFAHCEQKTRLNKIVWTKCKVYVLSGLPETLFEGILAHELMHVWTGQNCRHETNVVLAEGSANYASYLIYKRRTGNLAKVHIENLFENPDPIYGNGFRMVYKYIEENGLKNLLDGLRRDSIEIR